MSPSVDRDRPPDKCARCGLELPRGACHLAEEGCIEALREALDKATTCAVCGNVVPKVYHPQCMAKAAGQALAGKGVDAAERKIFSYVMGLMAGRTQQPEGEQQPQDDDPSRFRP